MQFVMKGGNLFISMRPTPAATEGQECQLVISHNAIGNAIDNSAIDGNETSPSLTAFYRTDLIKRLFIAGTNGKLISQKVFSHFTNRSFMGSQ